MKNEKKKSKLDLQRERLKLMTTRTGLQAGLFINQSTGCSYHVGCPVR